MGQVAPVELRTEETVSRWKRNATFESGLFGPGPAALVQAHLSAAFDGGSGATRVLRPFLLELFPGKQAEPGARFVGEVVRLVEELVDNVREHGAPHEGRAGCALVDVFVTGASRPSRIHLCVQDLGPGIVATARGKVHDRLREADPTAVVLALLQGEAGSWQRGRGFGLPRIWYAVRSYEGGRLSLATGRARVTGSERQLTGAVSEIDLAGTVVQASLRVP